MSSLTDACEGGGPAHKRLSTALHRASSWLAPLLAVVLMVSAVYTLAASQPLKAALGQRLMFARNLSAAAGRQEAYVIYLTSDKYLASILTMQENLRAMGATRPLAAMVSEEVTALTTDMLALLNITAVRFKLERHPNYNPVFPDWQDIVGRLQIFRAFHGYHRVVAMDLDVLLQNGGLDELFDERLYPLDFYSGEDNWECGSRKPGKIVGALLVFSNVHANMTAQLFDHLSTLPQELNVDDQVLLQSWFRKQQYEARRASQGERVIKPRENWMYPQHTLADEYIKYVWHCKCQEEKLLNATRMLHFTHWQCPAVGPNGTWEHIQEDCFRPYQKVWFDHYKLGRQRLLDTIAVVPNVSERTRLSRVYSNKALLPDAAVL